MPTPEQCQHCKTHLKGPYCYQCGQKIFNSESSVISIFFEWFDELFGINGTLWKTIKSLISKPGLLTQEYEAGNLKGYVRPVKMLITLTVLSALIYSLFGLTNKIYTEKLDNNFTPTHISGLFKLQECKNSSDKALKNFHKNKEKFVEHQRKIKKSEDRIDYLFKEHITLIKNRCALFHKKNALEVYQFWLLIPFLSLLTFFFFRNRQKGFVLHLIHSLHFMSFYNVLLLVLAPLRFTYSNLFDYKIIDIINTSYDVFFILAVIAYFFISLRRWLHEIWWKNLLKVFFIALLYGILNLIVHVLMNVSLLMDFDLTSIIRYIN